MVNKAEHLRVIEELYGKKLHVATFLAIALLLVWVANLCSER